MNYIYDIALNFHENYYNFFEWNKLDKIKNIKKIPIYHISDEDLLSLKNNYVILDNTFLDIIFKESNKKNIPILVSNTNLTIGLIINKNGLIEKKSSLLFEEEEEANNFCKSLKITPINYKKNIIKKEESKLRIESEIKSHLINYIHEINNIEILKYLYYEYFNKESDNIYKIKKSLLEIINNPWNNKQKELYNTIKLLKTN